MAADQSILRATSKDGFQLDPVVEAYKKDVDRTLLRENLMLSVEQRVLKLMELQRVADELSRALKKRES